MTADGRHSLDALAATPGLRVTAAFGPQHGLRGDKQDNMVESEDFLDPALGIPVFSLYGTVRRPTDAMLEHCDVLLVDLQDLGCRIYTFITTLRYVLEACGRLGKAVWVLDRPNPAGRQVEGLALRPGWESFVGAGPMPMRHGLTMGEMARWFVRECRIEVELVVVPMRGWDPHAAPGFGWPLGERSWVNPSPNAPNVYMARAYAGTVMLEGTTLSEGRGTTRPLELFGAPDLDAKVLRGSPPNGWQVAGCAPVGSSPPSTNTRASAARVCRCTRTTRLTTRRRSALGACRRWPSRPCDGCGLIIHYGGISPTSTRRRVSQSMLSTAVRCCASGSTTRPPSQPTSTRSRAPMRRRGGGRMRMS